MKEIIREYAEGIRIIIVVSGLFLIIFSGIGIYGKYRDIAYAASSDGMSGNGNKALESAKKDVPQIRVASVMECEQSYDFTDVFVDAKTGEKFASVRVMEIWYMDDTGNYFNSIDSINSSEESICIKKAGAYRAKVAVVDIEGKTNTQWMYFITEE